jgi:hypothetical protein
MKVKAKLIILEDCSFCGIKTPRMIASIGDRTEVFIGADARQRVDEWLRQEAVKLQIKELEAV